jgi:hypothetical protein
MVVLAIVCVHLCETCVRVCVCACNNKHIHSYISNIHMRGSTQVHSQTEALACAHTPSGPTPAIAPDDPTTHRVPKSSELANVADNT